ncbi:MAG: TetR/AcrR family transcriptional regulator [Mobilitalea sp.]
MSIINAGFMVFAEYGYSKASVDEIVKEANISKGSLFYYFESKKNFFLYLYEYCGEQLEKIVDCPGVDSLPSYLIYTDFFERLNAVQELKMKHSGDYPHMYNYMKKAVFDTAPAVKEGISQINELYTKERAMAFFQGLDYYKFKEGIDPMMVIQLVTWCSEGCANQVLQKEKINPSGGNVSNSFEEVIKLYHTYIQLFRNNFYKEEYL